MKKKRVFIFFSAIATGVAIFLVAGEERPRPRPKMPSGLPKLTVLLLTAQRMTPPKAQSQTGATRPPMVARVRQPPMKLQRNKRLLLLKTVGKWLKRKPPKILQKSQLQQTKTTKNTRPAGNPRGQATCPSSGSVASLWSVACLICRELEAWQLTIKECSAEQMLQSSSSPNGFWRAKGCQNSWKHTQI